MVNRAFILFILCYLFFLNSVTAQSRYSVEGGIFFVKYHAQTNTGNKLKDITSIAEVICYDIPKPIIVLTIHGLKWDQPDPDRKLVIKRNWMRNQGGLDLLTSEDLVLGENGRGEIRFIANSAGAQSIVVGYGIKNPGKKVGRTKEVSRKIQKKFSISIVNEPKLPPTRTYKEPKSEPQYQQKSREDKTWNLAESSNTLVAYQEYLRIYQYGKYHEIARARIKKLDREIEKVGYPKGEPYVDTDLVSDGRGAGNTASTVVVEPTLKTWNGRWEKNTFETYLNAVREPKTDSIKRLAAIDSIKKLPISFEFVDKKEAEKGDYQFEVKFSNVHFPKLRNNKGLRIEAIDSVSLLVILTKGVPRTAIFEDEFGREVSVKLDPNYDFLHAVLEETEEGLKYNIFGGKPPYSISFIRDGSKVKECMQTIGAEGVIDKLTWAEDCSLNGNYAIIFMDGGKNERIRFPEEGTGFVFDKPKLELLKYTWIFLLPILVGIILFIRKKMKE